MQLVLCRLNRINLHQNNCFFMEKTKSIFAKRATALGFYKQYGVSVELCSQIAGITEKEFLSEAKRSFIG